MSEQQHTNEAFFAWFDKRSIKIDRDSLRTSVEELRKACAKILDYDVNTWPEHGNASLAIAASLAVQVNDLRVLRTQLAEAEAKIEKWKDRTASARFAFDAQNVKLAEVEKEAARYRVYNEIAYKNGYEAGMKAAACTCQQPVERFASLIEAIIKQLSAGAGEPVAWVYVPHKELLWPSEVEAKNPLWLTEYKPLYEHPAPALLSKDPL